LSASGGSEVENYLIFSLPLREREMPVLSEVEGVRGM